MLLHDCSKSSSSGNSSRGRHSTSSFGLGKVCYTLQQVLQSRCSTLRFVLRSARKTPARHPNKVQGYCSRRCKPFPVVQVA